MIQDRCLIIFVRYPEAGKVKSRLGKRLPSSFVAGLYKNFVRDILHAMRSGGFKIKIYFDPPKCRQQVEKLWGEEYFYEEQVGAELGAKMENAFWREFAAGCRFVTLIGSDFPDLPLSIIEKSFAALDGGADCAIGPAQDGGYYLIAFRKDSFRPEIFRGLEWGTSSVFEKTMKILRTQKCFPAILPAWRDIDTREDLDNLFLHNAESAFASSHTMKYLRKNNFGKNY